MSVPTKPATQNKTVQKPAHFVAMDATGVESIRLLAYLREADPCPANTSWGRDPCAEILKNLIYCPGAVLPLSVRPHSSSALIAVM